MSVKSAVPVSPPLFRRVPNFRRLRLLDRARAVRIAMVILLIVSILQAFWWYLDQRALITRYSEDITFLYSQDVGIARTLLEGGTSAEQVERFMPHLDVANGQVRVRPDILNTIEAERNSRLFRYVTESAFFILVLFAGIAVIWKALSKEARIRRDQDNFLMLVSHEFKTPLASLQLAAESMLRRPPKMQDLDRKLRRMLSDLGRMQNMVSKILDSARLQQGQVKLNPEPVHLTAAVIKALNSFEQDFLRATITYDVQVPVDLYVEADPLALETVLLNVLENAHEAMRPDGHGQLWVRANVEGDCVEVSVQDSGIGFAPQKAANLFAKFYRTDDAYCGDKRGTGLGLYIVYRLMLLQNGSVGASSAGEGKGATITLRWPHSRGTA